MLVLALALGAVRATALEVRLQDAAGAAARSVGRGDDPAVAEAAVQAASPGAALVVEPADSADGIVCVTVAAPARIAGLDVVELTARACAPTAGR